MPETNTGYDRQAIDQLRETIDEIAKSYYGDDADVSDAAVIGMMDGVLSEVGDKISKIVEFVRWSVHLLSAENTDLDLFGTDDVLPRKLATNSQVMLQIDAVPGTEIPEMTQFATDSDVRFETTEDALIKDVLQVAAEDGTQSPLTDDNGTECGRIMVEAVSVDTGVTTNVGADTITVQAEPIDGVSAVTNPQPSTGGTDVESDVEYKARLMQGREHPKNESEDGIKTYLESEVNGVIQAKVIPNKTLETDKYGNPPKTTHIYVIGGKDQDVADGIFHILSAPANTVGAVSATVLNLSGDERTINFDRAKPKPVYAKVTIKTDDTFDTDSGATNIISKMKEYVDVLKMGDDVLFSKFFEYIWQVTGLKSVVIEIGDSKDTLAVADLAVDEFELATLDAANVEVVTSDS